MTEVTYHTLDATVDAFLASEQRVIREKNANHLKTTLTADATRTVGPSDTLAEMGVPGGTVAGVDAMAAQMGRRLPVIESLTEHRARRRVVDPVARTATVW